MRNRTRKSAALFLVLLLALMPQAAATGEAYGIGSGATLLIDAGHGGLDGGAVTAEGIRESEINLAIALRMHALCRLLGVSCVLTRDSEELSYPTEAETIAAKKLADQKTRAALIAETPHAVLISIHQNIYSSASARGAQVFYAAAPGSEALALAAQSLLRETLWPENSRAAAPISETIFLMRTANCPAILAECGFLSHPEEAALLCESDYQLKIAVCLVTAFLQTA